MSGKPKAVYRDRLNRYPDSQWLIWSNKWGCWYRPGSAGYTSDIAQAGIYDRDEAASHYVPTDQPRRHRDTEPFPLSSVKRMIVRRAEELRRQASEADMLAIRLTSLSQAPR